MTALPFPEDRILDTSYYGTNGIPHEAFTWLRKNDPVRKFEIDEYGSFWAMTKNEHIHEIEKRADIFRSYPQPILIPKSRRLGDQDKMTPEAQAFVQEFLKGSPVAELFKTGEIMRTLIHMDAPDHAKYRDLVQPWFIPRNLNALEHRLEAITTEILDAMMGDGSVQECEFVNDVAVYHPLRMLCELLGVPRSDENFILKLTHEFFAGDDDDLKRGEDPMDFIATVKDLYEYFNTLTEERRKQPTQDLGSFIANGTVDGKPMPLMETVSYYLVIATAGHDTTRNAIAGGCLALLQHPHEMKKWQDNLDLTKPAADEIIRWTVPVIQFARTAAEDYDIAGKQMKAGDLVGLFYASGCRDEDVIDQPFAFRVDRRPNKHVAFGSGPHICLGMLLARMEIQIFFKQFLPRVEMIELAGEPKLIQSSFIHGVKSLPIRYKLKPAA